MLRVFSNAVDQNFQVGIFDMGSKGRMSNQIYDKPYCRIGTYLAGVGCAYILDHYLNHPQPNRNGKAKLKVGDVHINGAVEGEDRSAVCSFLGLDRPTWLALLAAVTAAFFFADVSVRSLGSQ